MARRGDAFSSSGVCRGALALAAGELFDSGGVDRERQRARAIRTVGTDSAWRVCGRADSCRNDNRRLWDDNGFRSVGSEVYRTRCRHSEPNLPLTDPRDFPRSSRIWRGTLLDWLPAALHGSMRRAQSQPGCDWCSDGVRGFAGAIGVHFAVGYLDFFHLLPAFAGFFIFVVAEGLLWSGWRENAGAAEQLGSSDFEQTRL
jgi:hypothetical protein